MDVVRDKTSQVDDEDSVRTINRKYALKESKMPVGGVCAFRSSRGLRRNR